LGENRRVTTGTVQLYPSQWSALRELKWKKKKSISALIREAIDLYLQREKVIKTKKRGGAEV